MKVSKQREKKKGTFVSTAISMAVFSEPTKMGLMSDKHKIP